MAGTNCICSVEACGLYVRSGNAKYCEKHYMRMRRHGSLEKLSTLKPGLMEHSAGYLLEHLPGHPLARKSSRVYQHRAVYYQEYGDGPFRCHWCDTHVTWDSMHVDHVNADVKDNSIDNLVASCPDCNRARGTPKMRMTMKKAGRLLTAHGKTMCVSDWAIHLGISRPTIVDRIRRGMLLENALSSERSSCGPARRSQPNPEHVIDVG